MGHVSTGYVSMGCMSKGRMSTGRVSTEHMSMGGVSLTVKPTHRIPSILATLPWPAREHPKYG